MVSSQLFGVVLFVTYCSSVEISDQLMDTLLDDLSYLRKTVHSLEITTKAQNEKIAELKIIADKQMQDITDLKHTVYTQNVTICDLQRIISNRGNWQAASYQIPPRRHPDVTEFEIKETAKSVTVLNSNQHSSLFGKLDIQEHNAGLINQSTAVRYDRSDSPETEGIVAFYAYMSTHTINPSTHQTLIFDVAKTNVGNAYSDSTGVFTAPQNGVYVFVWVIRITDGERPTEIMINHAVYGATFLRAKNGDDGAVSKTVVAHINQGDTVFIRIHSAWAGHGDLRSDEYGRSTFAGWLLH